MVMAVCLTDLSAVRLQRATVLREQHAQAILPNVTMVAAVVVIVVVVVAVAAAAEDAAAVRKRVEMVACLPGMSAVRPVASLVLLDKLAVVMAVCLKDLSAVRLQRATALLEQHAPAILPNVTMEVAAAAAAVVVVVAVTAATAAVVVVAKVLMWLVVLNACPRMPFVAKRPQGTVLLDKLAPVTGFSVRVVEVAAVAAVAIAVVAVVVIVVVPSVAVMVAVVVVIAQAPQNSLHLQPAQAIADRELFQQIPRTRLAPAVAVVALPVMVSRCSRISRRPFWLCSSKSLLEVFVKDGSSRLMAG